MKMLQQIGDNIWIHDGATVSWYTMPYTTRMTVIRLNSGEIWIHSPAKISDELISEVNALGKVSYLVSPNKIHHLFMQEWMQQYPEAKSYAPPGLEEKRPDLHFDRALKDASEPEWQEQIEQLIFKGSKVMEEVIFFHRESKTLIVTDLIENFHPDHFKGIKKLLAQMTGIISPNGKMPIDWRMTFIGRKEAARDCLQTMINWQPDKIILAHGEWIQKNAVSFLKKSFHWLQ
ncbi:DUF4336 domain-containing protein [Marinomonas sp.]|jgi:hypothetical protein|uniref:DUF4336 domain-containing protein n=1 Tax=Marinomonas sp. TaxID=1904862 RepID=UPI003A8EED07